MKTFKIMFCSICIICVLYISFCCIDAIYNEPSKNVNIKATVGVTQKTYILNINSQKIHHSYCGTAKRIKEENRRIYKGDIEEILEKGYSTCGNCFK